MFNFRQSQRHSHTSWTNGLVEVQNKDPGTHVRMFLNDSPENWSFQEHLFAYAHNTQPSSHFHTLQNETVFKYATTYSTETSIKFFSE